MRRRLASLGTLVVVLAVTGSPVTALHAEQSSGPVLVVVNDNSERIVEQQTPCSPDGTGCGATQPDPSLWVVNDLFIQGTGLSQNYRCVWDNDDSLTGYIGGGVLMPGQSFSGDICYIADWGSHLWHLEVPLPLVGSITVGGSTIAVASGSEACVLYEYRNGSASPALMPIAGSNGGIGERTVVRFTITNPTSKRVRGLAAGFDVALGTFWHTNAAWCPGIPPDTTVELVGQHVGYDPIMYWMD